MKSKIYTYCKIYVLHNLTRVVTCCVFVFVRLTGIVGLLVRQDLHHVLLLKVVG